MLRTPLRHALGNVALDVFGHVLEERRRRAAAARTRRDLWREAPQPERLKDLLGHGDFLGPISARPRCQ
jgi:hypothetical protein